MKVRTLALRLTLALTLAWVGGTSLGCGGSRPGYEIEERLVARASTSASTGVAPLTVRFRDASSGAPVARRWSFGDGSESGALATSHVFTRPGRYTVSLEVTDVLGETDVAIVATVTVAGARPTLDPGRRPGAAAGGIGSSVGSPYWYQGDTLGNPLKQHSGDEAALAQSIHSAVNAERAKAGLPLLAADEQAARSAKAHAEDMQGRGYFDHLSPEGWTPEDRLRMLGATGHRAAAENIFSGPPSAATVVATWMASPGHRANVLAPGLTHLGVGVRAAGGASLVVAVFTAR